jgi:putative transposase
VGTGMLTREMNRHTTFKFCLDPTVEQREVLARHVGAARFAFNQCLRMVKTALSERRANLSVEVPWTGFDLINGFNTWKRSEAAGRILAFERWRRRSGDYRIGLAERGVPAGIRGSCRRPKQSVEGPVGFPLRRAQGQASWISPVQKKTAVVESSFRLRNRHPKGRPPTIRVGDNNRPRSVTLPGIGSVRVHDDTRQLRLVLANGEPKFYTSPFPSVRVAGGCR